MKRAIISGATGTIGTALINELIKNNVEVLVLCRENSTRIGVIPKSPLVSIIYVNLENFTNLENTTGKTFDVFYHFAWNGTFGEERNNMFIQSKNVDYSLDAVALAKRFGCQTFIGAGSQAEYGRVSGVLTSKTSTFPENGYGMAKLCAGQMTRALCQQLGIKHVWVRILSIYGPNDGQNTMIMSTINKLKNNQVPKLTKGEQMWDYLHSFDAARAFYLLADKGVNEKIYVLGGGEVKPLKEYIKILRDIVSPNAKLGLGKVEYSKNQVMYLCADIKDLVEDIGWKPQISFEKGIETLI